jgi:Tfp pilus assembly PilM family ATPase
MISYGNHAGFTITSSKIQLVEINYRNSQYFLQNVDEVYFDEHLKLLQDKETKIITVLQSAFNEILIRNRVNSRAASFTLPPEIFYTVQLPFDNTLLHQDLIEEIKWELSILFPSVFINDLVIQHLEVEKNRIVNHDTILVSALKRKYLHWLKYFCEENNLKIKFIDNSHFASERALTSSQKLNTGIFLSIYLSNNYLSFIFSLDGKPFLFKAIPYSTASEIPQLILKETSPTETVNINRSLIDSVYITGEDISSSFVDTLSFSTGIELKLFNPFENINPDSKLFENSNFSQKSNSFSPAAGIAFRRA